MKSLKKIAVPALFSIAFAIGGFMLSTKSVAVSNDHRVFFENKDVIGCYQPGGSCYSDTPIETIK